MNTMDQTTHFVGPSAQTASSLATIFDGGAQPRIVWLNGFGKSFIYFGRGRRTISC